MTRSDARTRALAAALAALAGYVDGTGFFATGGFFVSFMSGNSTRMGIGIAEGAGEAWVAAALIGAFLCGVIAGALIGHAAGRHRMPVVIGFVSILLTVAAASNALGTTSIAILVMSGAMGVENNVFARQGEVSIGVTYMTGSLVKLGQAIAMALTGRSAAHWRAYLILWGSFVAGVIVAGAAYPHVGFAGLWAAVLAAAGLTLASVLVDAGIAHDAGHSI